MQNNEQDKELLLDIFISENQPRTLLERNVHIISLILQKILDFSPNTSSEVPYATQLFQYLNPIFIHFFKHKVRYTILNTFLTVLKTHLLSFGSPLNTQDEVFVKKKLKIFIKEYIRSKFELIREATIRNCADIVMEGDTIIVLHNDIVVEIVERIIKKRNNIEIYIAITDSVEKEAKKYRKILNYIEEDTKLRFIRVESIGCAIRGTTRIFIDAMVVYTNYEVKCISGGLCAAILGIHKGAEVYVIAETNKFIPYRSTDKTAADDGIEGEFDFIDRTLITNIVTEVGSVSFAHVEQLIRELAIVDKLNEDIPKDIDDPNNQDDNIKILSFI
eukprot:GHVP01059172.1.p1 GENE.GHVP01059172.1~~GHVP01059172.1.p1  ORF type:complete len:332 (-),score=52.78 GHVP01059172.1:126-1121(-)